MEIQVGLNLENIPVKLSLEKKSCLILDWKYQKWKNHSGALCLVGLPTWPTPALDTKLNLGI